MKLRIINETRGGATLARRAIWARNALRRALGLLGTSSLADGEGMWLTPAGSIHMCGMKFPIDAIFLDARGGVVSLHPELPPQPWWALWRVARGGRGTRSVVELPAGTIGRTATEVGDRIRIEQCEDGTGGPEGGASVKLSRQGTERRLLGLWLACIGTLSLTASGCLFGGPAGECGSEEDLARWEAEGRKHFAAGEYAEALERYNEVGKCNRNRRGMLHQMGLCYAKVGMWREAEDVLSESIILFPEDMDARLDRGVVRTRRGKLEGARADYLRVLEHKPDEVRAHLNLGILYAEHLNDITEARVHLSMYLALAPNAPDSASVRAWLQGHGSQALAPELATDE